MIAFYIGWIGSVINILMGLIYRKSFLTVLSVEYLGINGLFSNIFTILSIAEMGIGTSIMYRLYEPIKNQDEKKIAEIIYLLKICYRIIMLVVLGIGLLILPVLPFLVNDAEELPSDINLYVVYFIFLFETLSSYFFIYKQAILSADQKQYVVSAGRVIVNFARYCVQFAVLYGTRNYILTLCSGIAVYVFGNYLISLYAQKSYESVMHYKGKIDPTLRQNVFNDLKGTACHEIGEKVSKGIDSMVISAFVGIASVGYYSNYSYVLTYLIEAIKQTLTSFVSSIGSANVNHTREENYDLYQRLMYLNYAVALVTAVCLYVLFEPFITLWVGEDMLLSHGVLILLCIDYYFQVSRLINQSFIKASGLFVRDKIRPIIQAALNLVLSIVIVMRWGIAGVFIGTIISWMATIWWREPYLLYKELFHKPFVTYWRSYFKYALLTLLSAVLCASVVRAIPVTWIGWLGKAIISALISIAVFVGSSFWTKEFHFYKDLIHRFITTKIGKRK